MAKTKQTTKKLDYTYEIRKLKSAGPDRLYFLWGSEDYLREQYLVELKKLCLAGGEDSFCYKRFDGPALDAHALRQAMDAIPFMGERSLIELRDIDLNHLKDSDEVIAIISDIPEYCTLVLLQKSDYEPDGRLKLIKTLRTLANEIVFTAQSQGLLTDWIVRHFADAGKSIELSAAQRLIFVSGSSMTTLLPEIEKIAAYSKGDRVSVADVDAVAYHIPESVIFDMTDMLSQKKFNSAMSILAELLSVNDNEPIAMLGALGAQMRKLYTARLALDDGLGNKFIAEACSIKMDFLVSKLVTAARGFSLEQLARAVQLCADADYRMKISALDSKELFKETVLRIAAGEK